MSIREVYSDDHKHVHTIPTVKVLKKIPPIKRNRPRPPGRRILQLHTCLDCELRVGASGHACEWDFFVKAFLKFRLYRLNTPSLTDIRWLGEKFR